MAARPAAAPRILLLTGAPGAGKTTLGRLAAGAHPSGLHIPADLFYTFPVHPIAPVRPESHAQNTAVVAAAVHAAATFARHGYEVVLEGIFGPWFLPTVMDELRATGVGLDYVILRLALDEALRRATERDGQRVAAADVRQMHAAFERCDGFAAHVLDVTGLGPDQALAELLRRRASGSLAVL